jgi:hypothetical protein
MRDGILASDLTGIIGIGGCPHGRPPRRIHNYDRLRFGTFFVTTSACYDECDGCRLPRRMPEAGHGERC